MIDWLIIFIGAGGLLAVAALMFLENVFPPIPSELILPLAGYLAAQGTFEFTWVVVAGTAGSVLGASLWYFAGRWLGYERLAKLCERYGRWLTVEVEDLNSSLSFFRRHGAYAMFFGRLIPGVRTLISIPGGIARLPLPLFLFWTIAGAALWTTILASWGASLGSSYNAVFHWIDPIADCVLIGAVLLYGYRLARSELRRRSSGRV